MRTMHVLIGVLTATTVMWAQRGPIETDRPDQTEGTAVTPVGMLQVEHGVTIERDAGATSVDHPATLLRFGISELFELRGVVEPLSVTPRGGTTLSGVQPLGFGAKVRLWREGDASLSAIGHVHVPALASKAFRGTQVAPAVRLTAAAPLSADWRLGVNLGMEWDVNAGPVAAIYTVAVGTSLMPDVGWYAEAYGSLPDGAPPDHRINGGLTWLLSDDLQLDAAAGVGLSGAIAPWFVGVGASYRLELVSGR